MNYIGMLVRQTEDVYQWTNKHCGQMGLLKRVVDERYNFGLQKAE